MKKMFNKIGTLLLLAVAVIAVSCSNEEMDDLNVSKVENKGVIKELENVNLEYCQQFRQMKLEVGVDGRRNSVCKWFLQM